MVVELQERIIILFLYQIFGNNAFKQIFMPQVEMIMPKMGESIAEATILKWLKNIGDAVEADESVLEIATDKVDSEIPAPAKGTIAKRLFEEGQTVQVGSVIAIINTEAGSQAASPLSAPSLPEQLETPAFTQHSVEATNFKQEHASSKSFSDHLISGKFYSPLVRNIAQQEGISAGELESIHGSGTEGRITKKDLLDYLSGRTINASAPVQQIPQPAPLPAPATVQATQQPSPEKTFTSNGNVEIIEMDRMRKYIAEHMILSKQTSAHVTSFVEADVTNIVLWREKIKADFEKRTNEKITYTPIFIEAVAKAIKDFPLINASVEGTKIIIKKNINIGMATALATGNLIVPVIKNADQKNLIGLTKSVNDLASRARNNKLLPDEIQDGTFTVTNVGSFGNVSGTPIINQPQVAILAVGVIKKKPAVVETKYGDAIAIRHLMFLSLSYDHRVIDGALGGSFLRKVADYLESFDINITL